MFIIVRIMVAPKNLCLILLKCSIQFVIARKYLLKDIFKKTREITRDKAGFVIYNNEIIFKQGKSHAEAIL